MKRDLSKSVIKCVKFTLFSYAIISIIYTSLHLYNSDELSAIAFNSKRSVELSLVDPTEYMQEGYQEALSINNDDDTLIDSIAENVYSTDDTETLTPSDGAMTDNSFDALKEVLEEEIDLYIDDINSQVVNDPVVKSKIFSGSMGPSDIKPFYYKAEQEFEQDDISITTIVTSDRIPVLSRLATRYKGPISAAIHVSEEDKEEVLELVHQAYYENPDMKQYIDVHLIVDTFDRQFNMWRNIAKLYARTDYVMMLDIDFYVCTDFRSYVRNSTDLMEMLSNGDSALVVPAFEFIDQSDGREWNNFPTSKKELIQIVNNEKIDMFHRSWIKGHAATDYNQWYETQSPYQVDEYSFSYEPYVILKKEGSPWCDERFIGYGANKAACLYEIYLSGINFVVLPEDFIIHQSHEYPESTRKKERLFNKKVYTNFREELCLRYARQFMANSLWNTSAADNLRIECFKVQGFQETIKGIDE